MSRLAPITSPTQRAALDAARALRLVGILTLTLLTAGALASSAQAAKRAVPFGTFGTVVEPWMTDPAVTPQPLLDSQMGIMAASGVESVRIELNWQAANPGPGQYDWSIPDRIILTAAAHGLQAIPISMQTPRWASTHPEKTDFMLYAPKDANTYGTFMKAAVERYGPKGSLWTANPSVRAQPVKDWQIWNEPAGNFNWKSQPWATSYTKILRSAYTRIHQADKTARVVTCALVGLTNAAGVRTTPDQQMRLLYKAGARKHFDVVSVHPFTGAPSVKGTIANVKEVVTRVRREMLKRGDSKIPMYFTEATYTAMKGAVTGVPVYDFDTNATGQKLRLRALYQAMVQGKLKPVKRIYWFTWASPYTKDWYIGNAPNFHFSGLVKWVAPTTPGGSWTSEKRPLLGTYQGLAQKYEGCRKTADARVCVPG